MFTENPNDQHFAAEKVNGPGIKQGPAKYKSFTRNNFHKIPQLREALTEEQIFEIEVVGNVLPFKANNYVVDQLIKWEDPLNDPIFRLTFPQKGMLKEGHFNKMADAMKKDLTKEQLEQVALEIRAALNPHPAGQSDVNVPVLGNTKVEGAQHKYDQTILFFPKQGQTCHAYCTFCFRWPQFVRTNDHKFVAQDIDIVLEYISHHPEITDILFTGGDPMVMHGKAFEAYIDKIIKADIPHLDTIRIGSKSLAYWPYTYINSKNTSYILRSFRKAVKAGYHVSMMGHFNHNVELETEAVKKATANILEQGVKIRTQSPIFNYINNDPEVWRKMWTEQVELGMVPYYMFVARDTGAQHYFKVSLEDAQEVFREAYRNVSGLARTVRGPSMSCGPGKVQVLGVSEVNGEKVFVLRFLQGRNPEWVHRPFFAKYDPEAIWIDDLEPAFGEDKFFYEDELNEIYDNAKNKMQEVV